MKISVDQRSKATMIRLLSDFIDRLFQMQVGAAGAGMYFTERQLDTLGTSSQH